MGDLVFINAPYHDFIKSLGYTGPGWYHRVMAGHMLHFGLCGWSAITHRIVATARVPKEALRAPLAEIEEAWDDPAMAKFSINSMIGTMGIRQSFLYEVTTSTSELDAPPESAYQIFTRHERGGVYDWGGRLGGARRAALAAQLPPNLGLRSFRGGGADGKAHLVV